MGGIYFGPKRFETLNKQEFARLFEYEEKRSYNDI